MLQYIDDHRIVYDGKEATKAEIEAATKRIESYPKKMPKQDEYDTYLTRSLQNIIRQRSLNSMANILCLQLT
tara:strand:- start:405 stop:620 length:216 start_codon:yes stop_codon:yes gene_type:complete